MSEVQPLVAVAILALLLFTLVRELASPPAAMVGALIAFVLVGIVPPESAFLGLANSATIAIAGLFIVARALGDHVDLDQVVGRVLGDGSGGHRRALARFVPPVILLSGFVNNTPLVATGAPVLRSWAERNGLAATKLLIPLSFAAIVGGVLTLIGTSTNLVVSGMLEAAGEPGLSFFELTPAGLPMATLGGIVLIAFAPRLLPDRRTPHQHLAGHGRDYTLRVQVEPGSEVDGVTIADAQLRDLPDTYLASVVRDGEPLGPAAPETRLQGGDELVFVGQVASMGALLARPGLVEAERAQTADLHLDGPGLVECIIGQNSELIGTTLKRVAFRGRYGGAVLALHRASERVDGKLGTVELHPGDALLVLADPTFTDRWRGHRDFAVVIGHHDRAATASPPLQRRITLATFAGMIALAASGLVPVLTAILLACTVLVATRTISFGRAIDALDLDVLIIVAAAIGLGAAVQASGLTDLVAGGLGSVAVATTPLIALAIVAIGTMLLTELISNVAAAALMVPIALDVAGRVEADPTGFAVAVTLAASASFLTPVGYQTNTIVYGLGGYRFTDYWRLGLPMAAATLTAILIVVPRVWG